MKIVFFSGEKYFIGCKFPMDQLLFTMGWATIQQPFSCNICVHTSDIILNIHT